MTENGILQNIRILDFSWVLAGPFATRMLADFGAEVIKIQPLLAEAQDKFSQGYSNNWNRNKLGISLNMQEPRGIEIAKKLISISDVVIENFSPRVMENWGLDYPELKKIKPNIIVLSLSMMGHSGSWKDFSGFGPAVQAFSGITYLTAFPDHPPCGLGYSFADHVAGLYASLALLGALEYRRKTGQGQYLDLSETEAMTSLLSDTVLEYTQNNLAAKPEGNSSDQFAPHGVYRCQGENNWCTISVSNDQEWEGFKRALGNPVLVNDKRFDSFANRLNNSEALDSLIQEWTQARSNDEVMTALQQEGVPAGKVQNADDLAHDPQLKARGFLIELDHPVLGKNLTDASPIHLSHNPPVYKHASPTFGQDNNYVYSQILGFSKEEIVKLKQEKII